MDFSKDSSTFFEYTKITTQKVKLKLSPCFLTEHHAFKAHWRVEV